MSESADASTNSPVNTARMEARLRDAERSSPDPTTGNASAAAQTLARDKETALEAARYYQRLWAESTTRVEELREALVAREHATEQSLRAAEMHAARVRDADARLDGSKEEARLVRAQLKQAQHDLHVRDSAAATTTSPGRAASTPVRAADADANEVVEVPLVAWRLLGIEREELQREVIDLRDQLAATGTQRVDPASGLLAAAIEAATSDAEAALQREIVKLRCQVTQCEAAAGHAEAQAAHERQAFRGTVDAQRRHLAAAEAELAELHSLPPRDAAGLRLSLSRGTQTRQTSALLDAESSRFREELDDLRASLSREKAARVEAEATADALRTTLAKTTRELEVQCASVPRARSHRPAEADADEADAAVEDGDDGGRPSVFPGKWTQRQQQQAADDAKALRADVARLTEAVEHRDSQLADQRVLIQGYERWAETQETQTQAARGELRSTEARLDRAREEIATVRARAEAADADAAAERERRVTSDGIAASRREEAEHALVAKAAVEAELRDVRTGAAGAARAAADVQAVCDKQRVAGCCRLSASASPSPGSSRRPLRMPHKRVVSGRPHRNLRRTWHSGMRPFSGCPLGTA
jgi:hypothetical protein